MSLVHRLVHYKPLISRPVWKLIVRAHSCALVDNSRLRARQNDRLLREINRLYEQCLTLLSPHQIAAIKRRHFSFKPSKEPKKDGNSDQSSSSGGNQGDENKQKELAQALQNAFAVSALITLVYVLMRPETGESISWQYFVKHVLSSGEVESISLFPNTNSAMIFLHPGAIIDGKPARSFYLTMEVASVASFEEKLRKAEKDLGISNENSVPIRYERPRAAFLMMLAVPAILLFLYLLSSSRKGTSKGLDLFGGLRSAKFTMIDSSLGESKGVRFSDVAGLKEAKVELMEFVDYLQNPSRYKELGAKVPKGALLLGPPGCGKTLLAKAVASEAAVPFLAMAGSEFIEMIGGLGAARVRDLFAKARQRSPCIIYIDEIDAIGRKRSTGSSSGNDSEGEQTLNQLLVEMDGMAGREGVILLASTNRSEVLDRALLRPGRFDRQILIDLPTLPERVETFTHHLTPIKLEKNPSAYANRLAQLTPGFSGAEIANVCNEAALNAAKHCKKMVTESDLEYAIERVVGGTEKRSTVISPDERKIVAYHESGHALVGWLLEHTDALLKVTIVPRTTAALGFAMTRPTDRKLYSKEELFDKMCMALGGRVAESIVFNRVTTGAQNDLKKVTDMAYNQVKSFGMDPVIGPLSFESETPEASRDFSVKPYSKKLAATIDTRVSMLVGSAYRATEKVILDNRDKLNVIAEALLKKETLNYQEIVELVGPPPHGAKKQVEVIDFGPMTDRTERKSDDSSERQPESSKDKNNDD